MHGQDHGQLDEPIGDSFTLNAFVDSSKFMSHESVAPAIREMVRLFKNLGASIHRGSRLHEYAKLFEATAYIEEDFALTSRINNALLEVTQFEMILRCSERLARSPSFKTLVGTAAEGAVEAEADRLDCKSRSIQFELFLSAWLSFAGYTVTLAEPDLLIQSDGMQLAIAAKRPRSEKKLVKNLRAGCKQIDKIGGKGFVAVDVSFLKSLSKPVYVREQGHHQILAKIVLDDYVLQNKDAVIDAVKEDCVIGVLFHYSSALIALSKSARLVSRRFLFLQTSKPPVDPIALEVIQRIQAMAC